MTKLIVLINNNILISRIEEVLAEVGEPDCKLINPYSVKIDDNLNSIFEPFLINFTGQNTIMISSDKILTITDPTEELIKKYESIVG